MTRPLTPDPLPETGLDELLIRPATDDDAPRVAEFAQRTFEETFGAQNTREDMAAHVARAFGREIQLREIRDPDIVTLLAELGPALAGFAQVRRGTAPACVEGIALVELWRFYVERPFHGRGIAHSLMGAVDDTARALGGRTLWLGVWERNPRAIAFYTKCGFVDVGEQTFVVGTDTQTDRVMARSLGR